MKFSAHFNPCQRTTDVVRITEGVEGYWPQQNTEPMFRVRPPARTGWMSPDEAARIAAEVTLAVQAYRREQADA